MSVDIDRIMGCLYVDNMTATEVGEIHRYLQSQEAEIERLQRIIDSRPAINAGLVEAYVKWTSSIYALDIMNATETKQ